MRTRSDTVISVKDVHTKFGTRAVHNGVSFDVERGTIVAIIGGSGAGKSVLFQEIIGLLKPTSGTVTMMDEDIWKASSKTLSSLRSRIGVLFQSGALFSAMTVYENIATPLRENIKLSKNIEKSIVESRLLLSELPIDAGGKMPSELSGGMVKRAALARALSLEPEILFLDEPNSGLDPINARALDALIRSLCDNLGITVCVITHDMESIKSITDKVVVLGDGKVITEGKIENVIHFDHPWVKKYFAEEIDGNEE